MANVPNYCISEVADHAGLEANLNPKFLNRQAAKHTKGNEPKGGAG
jgi:hypothetical protein